MCELRGQNNKKTKQRGIVKMRRMIQPVGAFFLKCRNLHLPSLNFGQFFSVRLSNLLRPFWRAHSTLGYQPSCHVCVVSELTEDVSSSMSLMNTLNHTGPNTGPWGTLVTGLQLNPVPFIMSLWDLLFSPFSIHLNLQWSSLRFRSFPRRMLCKTVLKTLLKLS